MPYLPRFLAVLAVAYLLAAPMAAQPIDEGIRLSVPNPLTLLAREDDPPQQDIFVGVTVSEAACSAFRVDDPNVPWMTLSKTSGNAPDGVTITIDYSTFAVNEERFAVVTFESLITPPNAADCLNPVGEGVVIFREALPITAKLLPGGPTPSPFPVPQLFQLNDATGSQQPISRFLDVINTGDGSFNYIIEVAYSGSTSGWLTVSPTGGMVSSSPQRHQVIANPAGLPGGTHQAVIRVLHDAVLAPAINIPVSLILSGPPRFSVSPLEISGSARQGKQNPPAAGLTVSNIGGGTLSYEVEASVPWITVTPTQGESASNAVVSHSVVFNALDLPVGVHDATITISTMTPGVSGNPVIVPVRIEVEPGGTISATPNERRVIAAAGSTEPQQVRIRLESPEHDRLDWRARVDPPNVQWLRLSERAGSLPSVLVVEVDPTVVPRPAALAGGVVVEAFAPPSEEALEEGENPRQSPAEIIRTGATIRLQTILREPELLTAPSRVEMIARPGDSVKTQPIDVSMGGGAPGLFWQASTAARGADAEGVFAVSPPSGSGAGVITLSANPAGLASGVYEADVTIRAGSQERVVPAALLVSAPGQAIVSTGQTGLSLKGSATGLASSVPVANLAAGVTPSIQVRPSTLSGGNWLTILSTASEGFSLRALGVGLNAGDRHGMAEIVAPGASNSPQYLPIVYERQEPGAAVELDLDRGGLVMASVGGAAVSPASLNVSTSSDSELRALIGVSTDTGVAWLTASPTDFQASARARVRVNVAADPSGLAPGVHRGRVTVAIPGGPIQSAAVTLVVAPLGPCTPRSVHVAPLAPPDGFTTTVGRPLTVEAGLIDDCGFPVRGGVVVAGASANAVLRDMGSSSRGPRGAEVFRGTVFASESGPLQLLFRGAANALIPGELRLSGAVFAGQGGQLRSASQLVHAATFAPGRAIAPGSIATLFGSGFPAPPQQPSELPLPESLEGLSVRVAGRPAPLFFLNATQANLQVPTETPASTLVQSLVQIGDRYLPPETSFTASAQPGVFALSGNTAVVINQDGSINTPLNPAARGQIVVAYLTGIGATLPATLTGQPAPAAEPFARPSQAWSAQIGGAEAEVLFLGLTPGFVGLAQANLRIAEDAATGAETPLVIDIGGRRSPPTMLAVEP